MGLDPRWFIGAHPACDYPDIGLDEPYPDYQGEKARREKALTEKQEHEEMPPMPT